MGTSYAVTWQKAGEPGHSGRLELQSSAIAFEGSNDSCSVSETIPYEDVTDVRIARSTDDRISDRQTLVLERRSGAPIRIAAIVQPGVVSVLAERLGRST
jgi:hypothetical protein